MAMSSTRSQEQARRITELEGTTAALSEDMRAQMLELFRLREQNALAAPSAPLVSPRHAQVGVQSLRLPNIDRFNGSREESAAFIRAVDNRLTATGQLKELAGLEWAVSHLAGYAMNWYLSYERSNPVSSWAGLRDAFRKEFGMVDEQRVLETRLLELKQTGSFEDYVTEFLNIEVRLTDQSDGFKQRLFLRRSNAYLRDRFAEREFATLSDLVSASLRLQCAVEASKFAPDVELLPVPVVAALPAARPRQGRRAKGPLTCFRCGLPGHKKTDCKVKLGSDGKPVKARSGGQQQAGRPVKERAGFGKYDGSGRVYAMEACDEYEYEDLSDDELRSGNDLA